MTTPTNENPYEAPQATPDVVDHVRRPIGVAILTALFGLAGLVLTAAVSVMMINWRENNEFAIGRRTPPETLWLFTVGGALYMLGTPVAMWKRNRWGWWLACGALVQFVLANLANLANFATALAMAGGFSLAAILELHTFKFIVRGCLAVLVLGYWLRRRVLAYYGLADTNRLKAVTVVTISIVTFTIAVTVALQLVYRFRTRHELEVAEALNESALSNRAVPAIQAHHLTANVV